MWLLFLQMGDPLHLQKFNHSCSLEFATTDAVKLEPLPTQHYDHFLVLDLEGKVEILEFPVLMISAKTLEVVDFFHRFAHSRATRVAVFPWMCY